METLSHLDVTRGSFYRVHPYTVAVYALLAWLSSLPVNESCNLVLPVQSGMNYGFWGLVKQPSNGMGFSFAAQVYCFRVADKLLVPPFEFLDTPQYIILVVFHLQGTTCVFSQHFHI